VLYANFVANGLIGKNNSIFDLNSPGNRDNCFFPYWLLREQFRKKGIILNTPDQNSGQIISFEIHLNVQKKSPKFPSYLLLVETPQVSPRNKLDHKNIYRKVFTWNDSLVDNDKYFKFYLPNVKQPDFDLGWTGRSKLCCVISNNKNFNKKYENELYSERIKTIRWFENNAPGELDLYGGKWDRPAAGTNYSSKLISKMKGRMLALFDKKPFASYKGSAADKYTTMSRYRFSICYENLSGIPGYITEKIFDSFFAGCIPIYWGASNVKNYIPANCFIDRTVFNNNNSLYNYIKSMSETNYIQTQKAIKKFLNSEIAELFYPDSFAASIVASVLDDFIKQHPD